MKRCDFDIFLPSVPFFETPLEKLKNGFNASHLIFDLPFKVFDCTVFVHIHSHNHSKLDSRSLKFVFIGYLSTQKATSAMIHLQKKVFTSLHVRFFKNTLYFKTPLL